MPGSVQGPTPGNRQPGVEPLGMRSLALAAMLGLLAGAPASAAEPAAAMFLCDPVHSGGHAADALGIKLAPLWRFRTNQLNRSTPVISDGVVYVGSNNGRFYALDAANGKPRWAFAAAGPSTPPQPCAPASCTSPTTTRSTRSTPGRVRNVGALASGATSRIQGTIGISSNRRRR